MARLPQPGSDSGQWGQILNDFLAQIHNTDGTLKDNVVGTGALAPGAVNASNVAAPGGVDGQVLVKDSSQASGLNWAASSGTGVTDHGALSGLADDDHPQYHTDARGDARYYTQAQSDSALATKANDVSVVKTTGNQSITGTKNFSSLQVGGQAVVATGDPRLTDARTPLVNSVSTDKLIDDSVTEPKLAASNTPTSGQILGFDGSDLNWVNPASAGDPVLGGDLSGTASAAEIVAGTVGTAELADNSVTNTKLADGAVGSTQLADGSVTGVKLSDGSVSSAKIADGTITEGDLSSAVQTKLNALGSGVGIQKVGTTAGTRPNINFIEGSNVSITATDNPANDRVDVAISAAGAGGAPDASSTTKGIVQLAGDITGTADAPVVADNAITTAKLADGSVATAKLADGNITTLKLANSAVNAPKLANAAITPAKLNTTAAPTNGQILSYDGATSQMKWVAASSPTTLAGEVAGPTSATVISNGVITYSKLSATGATAGQHLAYNGSALEWADPAGGATLIAGSGAPDDAQGTDGDVYIDTDTNTLYGPKAGGVWPVGQSLVGPAGATGDPGPEGISPPPFAQLGTLSVGTGTVRWYNDTGSVLNIGYVRAVVGVAPVGSTVGVDVKINGTSIFTTSPKPAIAANTYTKKVTAMDTTAIAAGQYFTVDITNIGSTTAGSDLYVTIGLSR